MIEEATGLAETAGYKILKVFSQKYLSRSKYGVGSGKAEELKQSLDELNGDSIIFDEHLSTVQMYNLAALTKREVIDRERLILEIFSRRATTTEAKTQIQLAELKYEIPRAKEKVRLAKVGEQPGFFGLGKYDADIYDMELKRRISSTKDKLKKIRIRKELYRIQRQRFSIPTISLSGYTGAGKTTIFNLLTGESKKVENTPFTTLSTSTRSFAIDNSKVLLSDTVGFISRLPTYLIESFKSTLEEVKYANLILLLLDASQPIEGFRIKYNSCIETLMELNVSPEKVLLVLNKTDLISDDEISLLVSSINMSQNNYASVSAKTGKGIDNLIHKLNEILFDKIESNIDLSYAEMTRMSDKIDWLKNNSEVTINKQSDGSLTLKIKSLSWVIDRFLKSIETVREDIY